jgi:hypothetical protein
LKDYLSFLQNPNAHSHLTRRDFVFHAQGKK